MSNYLSIAAVTASLKSVIEHSLRQAGNGATVTTDRPKESGPADAGGRVNIYLYQTSPNAARRNDDLPTRNGNGRLTRRTRAALDLHYLISFYGDEAKQESQQLMGLVTSLLHGQPLINQNAIRRAVETQSASIPYLAETNLAEEPESLRFTQTALNLEELSKLWSVFFQTPYTLSMAYKCSAVFLDGEQIPAPAPPVRGRSLQSGPLAFVPPILEEVYAAAGRELPVQPGERIVLSGKFQPGANIHVIIGDVTTTPAPESIREDRMEADLPDTLEAGRHQVRVFYEADPEASLPAKLESKAVTVAVEPRIEEIKLWDLRAESPTRSARVVVRAASALPEDAVLYLNERTANRPAAGYGFSALFALPPAGPTEFPATVFEIKGVETGTYYPRIEVNGVSSPLDDAGPLVDIPVDVPPGIALYQLRLSLPRRPAVVRGRVRISLDVDAEIHAVWRLPDGELLPQVARARRRIANFTAPRTRGLYVLTITDLVAPGYTFFYGDALFQKEIEVAW